MALLNNTFKSGLLFLGLVCILYGRSDVWGKMGKIEKMLHRSIQQRTGQTEWDEGRTDIGYARTSGEYDSDY